MAYVLRSPLVMSLEIGDAVSASCSHRALLQISDNAFIVDIPKSGSSFVKSSLISAGMVYFSLSPSYPHAALFKRPLCIEPLVDMNIYAFVRDPIDRFCSVVREKLFNNTLHSRGWSPYRFGVARRHFTIHDVDEMIKLFTRLPFSRVDKHLLPQSYFWSQYFPFPCFRLRPLSGISDFLTEHGIGPSCHPSRSISLVTDKHLFSADSLTASSLARLKDYYRSDLMLSV